MPTLQVGRPKDHWPKIIRFLRETGNPGDGYLASLLHNQTVRASVVRTEAGPNQIVVALTMMGLSELLDAENRFREHRDMQGMRAATV